MRLLQGDPLGWFQNTTREQAIRQSFAAALEELTNRLGPDMATWVRWLGGFALLAVIAQGLLGGLTVKLMLPLVELPPLSNLNTEFSPGHASRSRLSGGPLLVDTEGEVAPSRNAVNWIVIGVAVDPVRVKV